MSTTSYDSRPRAELLGIKDESTTVVDLEAIVLPCHLPYTPIFAKKGDGDPHLMRSAGANTFYGSETFDPTSKYFTHQSNFTNLFLGNSNPTMIQRLIPDGASTAMIRLYVEAITCSIPIYQRDASGAIVYTQDQYNARVPVQIGTEVGTRLVFHTNIDPAGGTFDAGLYGSGAIVTNYRNGSVLGTDGEALGHVEVNGVTTYTTSTLYPIMDIRISSAGEHGDDTGVRLGLPTVSSTPAIDLSTFYSAKSYLPRIGVVTRNNTSSSWTAYDNINGASTMAFSFKPAARTDSTNSALYLGDTFVKAYTQTDSTVSDTMPPFDKVFVYTDAIKTLCTRLIGGNVDGALGEASHNAEAEVYGRYALNTTDALYMLNFLGGADENGLPYFNIDTANSSLFGGITITDGSVIAAAGGDDGLTMNADGTPDEAANYQVYDSMVRDLMNGFATSNLMNRLKYPISAIWDSGFSMETKKALCTPIGARKDIAVILSTYAMYDYQSSVEISCSGATNTSGEIVLTGTFDVYVGNETTPTYSNVTADQIPAVYTGNSTTSTTAIVRKFAKMGDNDEATEISVAGTLRTYASAYPESETYGTYTCRALVVSQTGALINSTYTNRVPLTIEIANKVSKFMGSATGYWLSDYAYDQKGQKYVELVSDINLVWKKDSVANQMWANGLVYAIDYDMRRQFFPAVRTVYNDDTSVLNSSITMFACCLLERFCDQVWRDLVGNAKFAPAKFITQSNEMIAALLTNRFDDRFQFDVSTSFTSTDSRLGYRWTTKIVIYAPNMELVGSYSIISRRISDYAAAA